MFPFGALALVVLRNRAGGWGVPVVHEMAAHTNRNRWVTPMWARWAQE
jgi:hypothetical protein